MGFGQPRTRFKSFKFIVEIDGFTVAGFMEMSALKGEAETIEVREGGSAIPAEKSPGTVSFEPVTLRRGATTDNDAYLWWLTVIEAASGHGSPEPTFRRNLALVQLDRAGIEQRRWDLVNAWPKGFTAGSWDSSASEAVVEELTLEYDYFVLGS